jgi:hypothetical protein
MRRLVSSAALVIGLVLGATGCGEGTAGAQSTNGDGALGGGSATTPAAASTTATGSAKTTAAPSGAANPLGPVTHAALANKSGYVWDSAPTSASFTATDTYVYNSTGGAVTIAHSSTGRYAVTFAGLGTAGGVAHANAYGNNPYFCNVVSWIPSGADEVVNVACYSSGTSLVDSTFVANFASGHQGSAHLSYLWSDNPTEAGQHVPSIAYRYDSTGHDPWIKRISAGRYLVFIPASYGQQGEPYTFQVTAYGLVSFRCHLAAAYVAAGTHEVQCRSAVGILTDASFSLTYSSQGNIIGRTDQRYGDYTDASDGVLQANDGVYTVSAAGLNQDRGQVVVDARGTTSNYCHVGGWSVMGPALSITVYCFSPIGAPADSPFMLGVTW